MIIPVFRGGRDRFSPFHRPHGMSWRSPWSWSVYPGVW